jgi:hypothetical protein
MRDNDRWIAIKVTPLVEHYLFKEAQRRLAANRERSRKLPSRSYLLTGMLVCADCNRPYFTQTQLAGNSNRCLQDRASYRHRIKHGHCRNKQVMAARIDAAVWDAVVKLLLDPKKLQAGYESSLEQQKAKQARQRVHLERLCQEQVKLNQRLTNLTTAYVDPDIQMSKLEYLAQRELVQGELAAVQRSVEEIESELAAVLPVTDYESFAAFSGKIREKLQGYSDPTVEEKRGLLERLNVTVFIDVERQELSIEGWFDTQEAGLTSITYS